MRFEDDNFEEEFLKWLDTKTENDIIEGLKKYAINDEQYSYNSLANSDLGNENTLDYIEAEKDSQIQIDENKIHLKGNTNKKKNKKQRNIEVSEILELGDAA